MAPGALTLGNFVIGTLSPLLALLALGSLAIGGPGPLTGLGWLGATAVSVGVVYLQRLFARLVVQGAKHNIALFLLEPIYSGMIGTLASYLALARLSSAFAAKKRRLSQTETAQRRSA